LTISNPYDDTVCTQEVALLRVIILNCCNIVTFFDPKIFVKLGTKKSWSCVFV